MLEHATEAWPGSGSWLQISGFTFAHRPDDAEGSKITNLRFSEATGGEVIDDDDHFWVVTSRFLHKSDSTTWCVRRTLPSHRHSNIKCRVRCAHQSADTNLSKLFNARS